jgi:hypothetical protein
MEDAPLLLTLQPPAVWAPSWRIADADGHAIGGLRPYALNLSRVLRFPNSANGPNSVRAGGLLVEDRFRRIFALLDHSGEGTERLFRTPDGMELGTLTTLPDGQLLTFGFAVEANPFAKMLLLAAAIAD